MRALVWICVVLLLGACRTPHAGPPAPPPLDHGDTAILDAHYHAFPEESGRGNTPASALADMDAAGIDRTVVHLLSAQAVDEWTSAAPDRFLAGVSFPCWHDARGQLFVCDWGGDAFPDLAWLRAQVEAGRVTHLGEMSFIYAGIAPDDPRMAPYWALAAEKDLPVLVHINRGPPPDNPMRKMGCCPRFDADLGNPDRLRPILERHPDLKIVLQHIGFPPLPMFDDIGYVEETFQLLHDYPNVMAEMSAYHSVPLVPPDQHAALVRRMKDEGLLDRLMFATDNWPAAPALARYRDMDFLTDAERRAILHDNAARLFGVD